jgi:hypothetical protein
LDEPPFSSSWGDIQGSGGPTPKCKGRIEPCGEAAGWSAIGADNYCFCRDFARPDRSWSWSRPDRHTLAGIKGEPLAMESEPPMYDDFRVGKKRRNAVLALLGMSGTQRHAILIHPTGATILALQRNLPSSQVADENLPVAGQHELGIKLKTTRTLGLKIPSLPLLHAQEAIQ